MQSVPTYYPPNFPPTSPYANTTAAASGSPSAAANTDSTGNGTAAISVPTPPVMASTLGQNLMETDSTPAAEPTKRNQVKNACTNCQKACKKCDDARPCPRCEKYGIADSCVNSVRKERKKGIKRGPYKRRQKNDDKDQAKEQVPPPVAVPAPPTVTVLRPAPPPADFGYPTQLSQYQNYETYNYAISAAAAVYNSNNPSHPHPLPVYSSYPAPVLVNGDNTTNNENKDTDTNGKNNDPTSAQIIATLMTTNPSYLQAMNGIASNATPNTEDASKKPEEGAKQPTTPIPSTSNSSGTTSPSVGHEDDEKFARLTQLCSAALRENKEAQEKKAAEGTTEATTEASGESTAAPANQDEEMTEAQ